MEDRPPNSQPGTQVKFFQSSVFLYGQTLIVVLILAAFGFLLAERGALRWWIYPIFAALFIVALRFFRKEQREPVLEITDEELAGKLAEFSFAGGLEAPERRRFHWSDIKAICFSSNLKWEFLGPVFYSKSFSERLNLFILLNGSETIYHVPTFNRVEDYLNLLSLLRSKTTVREIHALSELKAIGSSPSASISSD